MFTFLKKISPLTRCRYTVRSIVQVTADPVKQEVHEVTIPVPWGYVAGRWWGDKKKQPIVAFHGVQDNAASFDTLIPLLCTNDVPVFAIDFPGHGKSDHLPAGIPPHYGDVLVFLRNLFKYYYTDWKKLTLIGHSFGSSACFAYAALYPDDVAQLICIECAHLRLASNLPEQMKKTFEKTLKYEKSANEIPSYCYNELVTWFYKGRKERLSLESCKVLLTRGITESKINKEKYHLSRDASVKLDALGQFSVDFWNTLASRIRAKTLIIEASSGLYRKGSIRSVFLSQLDTLSRNAQKFDHVIVEGGHHVHLDDPQKVAPIINSFLNPLMTDLLVWAFVNVHTLMHRKWWGDPNSNVRPILAIHGWQDNAGSFDRLIEQMKLDRPILAIDLPGHGWSSPLYPTMVYHEVDTVLVVRRIQKHYNWDKVTFLSHSLGGVTSFLFSSLYPEFVDVVINLDLLKPLEEDLQKRAEDMGPLIDKIIDLMKTAPSQTGWTSEELKRRWIKGSGNSLTEQSAEILMKRGLKEIKPGRFIYSRDCRLKAWQLQRFELSENLKFAKNIKCHFLLINATKSPFYKLFSKNSNEIINILKENAKTFEMITVNGTHHFHLNDPDLVGPIIVNFLNKVNQRSKFIE
ncbi:uncharacterized protein LOC142322736 [Lycorma delicatula]|uniref:uncharacterized protein LOC142322736 n=1 Tax=Lycorma delicatula TaxID=130591 RepID=UPI003F51A92E